MTFLKEQIKRFFNTGKWALKLIFIVVLVERGIVVGAIATQELDANDCDNIKHMLSLIATKSFALYAAEKGSAPADPYKKLREE